jgi:hypothetical protein
MRSYRSYLFAVKRALWITGLLALLTALAMLGPIPVQAQDITPRHTDPNWQAQYWNNPDLSGQPSLVRTDNDINFEWGLGAPAPGINTDNFSVRWTRYIDVTPGTYRFSATSDDGVRVWVDGQHIIDAWKEQAPTLYTGTIYLGPGHHLVVVEYFERYQGATAKVSWQMVQQDDTGSGPWRAEYFNNVTLSGSPVLIRQEQAVDFNWGQGSPSPLVDSNSFSARWSRSVDLPAGNYRFRILVDDGARLFVNGHTLIDAWKEQAATTYTGDIYLPGGAVTIQMEYFERAEVALAQLTWERIDGQQPITEWKGEYWNNMSLSGTPTLVRNEPFIDFNWGNGSPAPNLLGTDHFSARWTRTLDLSAGWYRFVMTVDDGGRLYLGGRLVIDAWRDQASTGYDTSLYHTGGALAVRMDYYENTQFAAAQLLWAPLGTTPPTPVPTPTPAPGAGTVVVDDLDGNFVRGGNASGWNTVNEGYNGHLYWSRNNTQAQSGYNWGRWYPNLRPGRYEVSVYIPDRYTTTGNARYWISHAGGYTLRVVNQSANGGRWVSLGTYNFRGTRDDYVSLADVTYEAYVSRLIAWDAVRWEPR